MQKQCENEVKKLLNAANLTENLAKSQVFSLFFFINEKVIENNEWNEPFNIQILSEAYK